MDAIGPDLEAVEFSMFSPDEIRKLSVLEIITPLALNSLGHPLPGGLYDNRLGPHSEHAGPCGTCQATERNCPGHFGHIEFPLPVVNPLYHKGLFTILQMTCQSCYRIRIPERSKALLSAQLALLDRGLVSEAQGLHEIVLETKAEGSPEDVDGVIVKDALNAHVAKFQDLPKDLTDTTIVESLRAQYLAEALKGKVHGKTCSYCKAKVKPFATHQNRIMKSATTLEVAGKFKDGTSEPAPKNLSTFVLPSESRTMMRSIWQQDKEMIMGMFPVLRNTNMEYPTDLFFIENILVSPPKVRPLLFQGGAIMEPSQTAVYKQMLSTCIIIRLIRGMIQEGEDSASADNREAIGTVKGDNLLEKLNNCLNDLQTAVDKVLDASIRGKNAEKTIAQGLKQVIEKKEGILRMHMMGKRVNYAARSVITPDPNLNVEEIGVPEIFAKKLTYPERYNGKNFDELRKLIENGPDVYPGANFVETGGGKIIKLWAGKNNLRKRISIAKQLIHSGDDNDRLRVGEKIVHRHLANGDMLILNRQPTLHRPSMMAHKARILKGGKTLRLHYSNCKSYNADFDGDEMNAHCPQNEVARAEAMHIANVANQYLVPKDGTPLGGLIQDHVISAVHLTTRGQMLSKTDYQQLVFQALSQVKGDIKLLPPCMIKPKKLWSGKQVISTILLNIIDENKKPISMISEAKTRVNSWQKYPPRPWKAGGTPFTDIKSMSEAEVIVHQGQMVCGVLDKQHFGATEYSLTHCLYELYGGETSSKFLNSLGRVFTFYLQLIGFTIGVEDILVQPQPDRIRKTIIEGARQVGDIAAAKALQLDHPPEDVRERLEQAYFQDPVNFRARLDNEYKQALDEYTNKINKTCLPQGLISKFPRNNLQLMVVAGAKGSTVNTMQISCLLGQIELEGKRPPLMLSGRSLPSFRPFETAPRAGGFIDGRFMTGIQPQDFFFHCMAGREGLIDTAVKTSRSGYLQRCLIKHLEGLSVAYDHTVRNHDGTAIQFAYGEDGMEVQKAVFLKPAQMDFLYKNRHAILNKTAIKSLRDFETGQKIAEKKEALAEWRKNYAGEKLMAPFTNFSASVRDNISEKYHKSIASATGRPKAYKKTLKKWVKLDEDERSSVTIPKCPDPITSYFYSHRDFGAISEKLELLMSDYLRSRPELTKRKAANMQNLIALKSMMSLCSPGEPVGLLAAQSVGEPSTQMTLNTFHFAGRGEMNVTLGIPRLREILMTASKNMKTPSLEIPLLPCSKSEKVADRLRRKLQRVTVADVLENVTVVEKLVHTPTRAFTYTVRFNFLPHQCYKKEFNVTPSTILKHMEKPFLVVLSKAIRLLGKRYGELIHEGREEKLANEDGGEDDYDDEPEPVGESVAKKSPVKTEQTKEDDESSDDEEPDGEADATTERRRARHQEAREYDEDTEASDGSDSDNEDEAGEPREDGKEEADNEDVEAFEAMSRHAEVRQAAVLRTFQIIRSYSYDLEKEEWCEFVIGVPLNLSKIDFSTLMKEICESSIVYEVKGIKRAIAYKNDRGEMAIKTDGVNIPEVARFDRQLNLQRLYCNDVHMMASIFGVEAAGRVIVRELQGVFRVYGITVDPRHLLLIADYMTMQGVYLPLSRTGMAANSSALQQMTFESAIAFLKKAVFRGRRDGLASPSARVMVGRPCRSGTGSFQLRPSPEIH